MPKILRDGLSLALQQGNRRVYLRHADGVVTPGCNELVQALDSGNQFTLDGLPDEIAEAVKQMVVSADGLRDGDGHSDSGTSG